MLGFQFCNRRMASKFKQEEVKTICTNRRDDDITLSKMSETHLTVWGLESLKEMCRASFSKLRSFVLCFNA